MTLDNLSFAVCMGLIAIAVLSSCDGYNPATDPANRGPEIKDELILAAAKGHTVRVKELLAQGAEVDKRSRSGYTALHMAAEAHRPEVVKILLDAGAEPNSFNRHNVTAIEYAYNWYRRSGDRTMLEYLINAGADPHLRADAENVGLPVYVRAKMHGEDEIVALFDSVESGP